MAATTRPILPHEKRTQEYRDAISEHATKLLSYNAFKKLTTPLDFKPVRSFFVGRVVDDKLTARLVSNGALEGDTTLDSYLPLMHERRVFLKWLTVLKAQGWIPFYGDFSGAYYTTKGEGFLSLP